MDDLEWKNLGGEEDEGGGRRGGGGGEKDEEEEDEDEDHDYRVRRLVRGVDKGERARAMKEGARMVVEELKERIQVLEEGMEKKDREMVALSGILAGKKLDYEHLKNHCDDVVETMEVETTRLKCEKARLMDKLKLPESDRTSLEQEEKEIAELKRKLEEGENRLQLVQMENDEMKQEVRELQLEMEEVQDQYKEEETARVKEMKKELEQSLKSFRIVQYKLKKTERRLEMMEEEKGAGNAANKPESWTAVSLGGLEGLEGWES